jgi:hypothetical protein
MAQAIPADVENRPSPLENLEPGIIASKLRGVADSLEIPSTPLFGVLPVRRIIPQDFHSVVDYANGFLTAAPALFGDRSETKLCGVVLGVSVVGVSLLTDYRLSVAKVIPIEVHEVIDYVWGAACIAAPFVFGYYKKDTVAAFAHIATGVATIFASLFTDYRAAKGIGRSRVARAAMQGATIQPGLSQHLEY